MGIWGRCTRGLDEATLGAPTPPTRGFGSWLRGSPAQVWRFERFLCKLNATLRNYAFGC
uniref:Uncharacterized protein n=1 Tax=Oryza sativa subsp. japonica TaxID=39947 RepID=Q6YS37_ORYSJ|nr:hypothetical protein [Oryza sativa Japonica Group]BAD31988.1 hypothetical protein [Oryza sativa Japonica Group]